MTPIHLSEIPYAVSAAAAVDLAPIPGEAVNEKLETRLRNFNLGAWTLLYYWADGNGDGYDIGTDAELRFILVDPYGRQFVYVQAWDNYTGWGCQDGGTIRYASTLDALVRFGLEQIDRERWGLEIEAS